MKKRLAMIVTMLMVTVSMAACGGKKDTTADKESVINTEATEGVAETEEPETEAVAEQETTGKLESNTSSAENTAAQPSDNNTSKSNKSNSNSGNKASAGSTASAGTTTSNSSGTTGSSNSNTNASNNNAAPAHEHKWVLHEGSGHYETQVVKEAWDEPVYEMREITRCSTCNADISSWSEEQIGDHIEAHILAGEDKGGYYSTGERVQTGTKHHDAETKQVWVQDVAPYAQCSGCGEIGPVGSGISIN
ncbi:MULTISPECIES: hypothetical protein [unclassified Roseburia]|uniref:hypothetical protein n=1 Tax=unclassified Roseburia TaxID=2637578 RepID=UPI000E53E0EF|nr:MULTISPECIES: hypothetical protein [unclassified Roseburia]RHQ41877.1 hypothetical protein DWY43_08355 [Roseburia sp. AF25-18LB]RHQ48340.1 hypothetical protein DWY39_08305 [Roseburia sp. AF25-15LB]RHQ48702.1 hypothetical protein DWY37_09405 [Roseburia sp. AF25-13LB]